MTETILVGLDREEILSLVFAIEEFNRNPLNRVEYPFSTQHLGEIRTRLESILENPWEN